MIEETLPSQKKNKTKNLILYPPMLVNAVVSAALLIQGAVAAPLAGHSFVAPTKSDVSNALQNSNIGYTIGAPVLTNAVNIYCKFLVRVLFPTRFMQSLRHFSLIVYVILTHQKHNMNRYLLWYVHQGPRNAS